MWETDEQKRTIQRWLKLAIQLNGAADCGRHDNLTTAVVLRQLRTEGDVFGLLRAELPAEVWEISKLTDVDCHVLAQQWTQTAAAYEPKQFHVESSGLALLVAYTLHLIANMHAVIPR